MLAVALNAGIILLLILANGMLAMAEIAVVSARRVRLEQRAQAGDQGAAAALDLHKAPGRFLSIVQVGITLVGVLAGAFGGATLAEPIAANLAWLPLEEHVRQGAALGLVVVTVTYLSLILGELVPKRVGLSDPEGIAASLARPLTWLAKAARPLVAVLTASTSAVMRLLPMRGDTGPEITEEEIKVLMRQGQEEGSFVAAEREMVERVFRLEERRVGSLSTPRTEIAWLDLDEPLEQTRARIRGSVHTRFPVAQGSLDHVIGVVESKDLLAQCLAGGPIDLSSVLHQVEFIPESMKALEALNAFEHSGLQIALVMDEYAGLQGLVTTYDVFEALVGELPAHPAKVSTAQRRDDGSWLIDGMLATEEFKDLLDLPDLPAEERAVYETVGGLVMTLLGHVPVEGDKVEWRGLTLEVVDMDDKRVDKVLVIPPARRLT